MAVVQGAPSLDHSFGAILIGTFVGLVLYGLTLHQTYRYTRICYAADRSWLKALVIAIVCLESLHIVVTVVTSYYHLVSGYSNPGSLGVVHWSTKALAPISGVTILLCQAFYAYRVYILGSLRIYRTLVVSATILMTVILGFTIAAFVMSFRVSPAALGDVSWLTSGIFGTAFLVDVLLTGTLVTVLLRSRTGFSGTDALIDTLIIYSMNTGLLTSILSLISFILVTTAKSDNLIWVGTSIVTVKIYANSVLAVLNSRHTLSGNTDGDLIQMSSFTARDVNAQHGITIRKELDINDITQVWD